MKKIIEGRMLKKRIWIILALAALLLLLPQTSFAALQKGTCGPDLTWEFNTLSGTLYIRGSGEMDDWPAINPYEKLTPWSAYTDDICRVVLSGDVTGIGENAFEFCTKLTEIDLPLGLKSIGDYAFTGTPLKKISIPASVTDIGEGAFMRCTSLRSVSIGSGVKNIGNSAFRNCSSLSLVYTPNLGKWCSINFKTYHANPLSSGIAKLYSKKDSTYELVEDAVIPEGTERINSYAFYNYKPLKSVVCPSTVEKIGDSAFYNCSGLTNIVLSDNLKSVGSSAFNNCTALTAIDFPDNVVKMGGNTFNNCTSLSHVTLGKSLDCIEDDVFKNCKNITDIVIPDTAKSIGSNAFYHCDNLASITIGSSVSSVGLDAFYYCPKLKKVDIRDIAAWCNVSLPLSTYTTPFAWAASLYHNGAKVTDLVIPEGVTTIKQYAFSIVSGLNSVTIPEGVTSIGQYAFDTNGGLNTVKLPSTLEKIGQRAFFGAAAHNLYVPDVETWLNITMGDRYANPVAEKVGALYVDGEPAEHLVIPEGTTTIDSYRFAGMANIKSITFPESLRSIAWKAFYCCNSISDIYFPGTADEWQSVAVENENGSLSDAAIHTESAGPEMISGSVFSEGSVLIIIVCIILLLLAILGAVIAKRKRNN